MAAELVETTRLWARVVARIEPEWAERLAGHLVKRSVQRAALGRRARAAVRRQRDGSRCTACRSSPSRKVHVRTRSTRCCPASCSSGTRWSRATGSTQHAFFHDNRALLDEVAELEDRARRRDIVVDDETLFAFYDARVGAEVVSARHFDTLVEAARRTQPDLLTFTAGRCWSTPAAAGLDRRDYPASWRQGELELAADVPVRAGRDATTA